ncbi:MAG: hypothetical protein KDB68_02150 [Planctomycetes bacterium]|nr:hypothetical protein [Planctomycetota bacterium]
MRHMWLNANRIVAAGSGENEPSWAEVEMFATDIHWRAELYASYWQLLVAESEEGLFALEDEDRIGVSAQIDKVSMACDSCHAATWSPWYLRVNEGTLDQWKSNEPRPHIAVNPEPNPPLRTPHLEEMKLICDNEVDLRASLDKWDLAKMEDALTSIRNVATARSAFWKPVVENSATIMDLAQRKKREGLSEAYGGMTFGCLACHASNVGKLREINNPVPWTD